MKLRVIFSSCQQLLPGISDDVTFVEIIPKLPWRAFSVLSSVSHLWRNTIQSRKIYDERVRCTSTETLTVIQHEISDWGIALSLYSLTDQAFYQLPGIHPCQDEIPESCQFLSLNGKLYVLGGYGRGRGLYELDLAGQKRQWEQCASMPGPDYKKFACGVMDGRIFVFSNPVSAVYDPKENAWSHIKPMRSVRGDHRVITIGEEMLVHGRHIHQQGLNAGLQRFFAIYLPIKDEWRVAEHFVVKHSEETPFVAQGKLCVMCDLRIFVIDRGDLSWTQQHSNLGESSWMTEGHGLNECQINPCAIVAVDNELLATLQWRSEHNKYTKSYLFHSQGFGCENKVIVWQKVQCPLSHPTAMCSIQL